MELKEPLYQVTVILPSKTCWSWDIFCWSWNNIPVKNILTQSLSLNLTLPITYP